MFVYEQINSANPYAMPEELEYLRAESLKLNPLSQVVMLGCGPGSMAVAMLEQHPAMPKMTIIDIDTSYYAEAHLRGAGVDPNYVQFFTDDSSSVGKRWVKKIDLLIVDADHEYAGVKADIEAWWPHVKPGGIVFFHDYLSRDGGFNGSGEWQKSGVAQAIEECRDSSWQVIKAVGISMVYMKV